MVPAGMQRQAGMRAQFYPKALWERVQKGERIEKSDEARLKLLMLDYAFCHATGCTAETEATAELITDLTTNAGLMVFAINASGRPIAFPVPLNGFRETHHGARVDSARYHKARNELIRRIHDRQQQIDPRRQ